MGEPPVLWVAFGVGLLYGGEFFDSVWFESSPVLFSGLYNGCLEVSELLYVFVCLWVLTEVDDFVFYASFVEFSLCEFALGTCGL